MYKSKVLQVVSNEHNHTLCVKFWGLSYYHGRLGLIKTRPEAILIFGFEFEEFNHSAKRCRNPLYNKSAVAPSLDTARCGLCPIPPTPPPVTVFSNSTRRQALLEDDAPLTTQGQAMFIPNGINRLEAQAEDIVGRIVSNTSIIIDVKGMLDVKDAPIRDEWIWGTACFTNFPTTAIPPPSSPPTIMTRTEKPLQTDNASVRRLPLLSVRSSVVDTPI